MFKLQYFDSDGDMCEREFSNPQELDAFANSLPIGDVIGVLIPESQSFEELSRIEDDILLTMHFPKNKVN